MEVDDCYAVGFDYTRLALFAFVVVCLALQYCLCCYFSLQRVLGLKTLDGILNPVHVNGKHIVHNIFNVNKAGIVILENKAGTMLDNSF